MSHLGRLLYISGYHLDINQGCSEHVNEMCHHLAQLGWQVTLVGLVNDDRVNLEQSSIASGNLKVISVRVHKTFAKANAIYLWRAVANLVDRHDYDLVYVRPAQKTVFALAWLRQKSIPYFVEVNSNTAGEHRVMGSRLVTIVLADWLEKVQFGHATGAFCVTNELANYASARVSPSTHVWVTGNGFRAERTSIAAYDAKLRRSLGIEEHETVVTFLGSLQAWQGIDILLEALPNLPAVKLWGIGNGPEKPNLERQAHLLGIADRVHWWGHQDGDALQQLLGASDIAIGSLALYRKNMYEAQPLKVRHYLGVGLPTIIGYQDTLLDETIPGVFYAQTPQEIVLRVREIQKQDNMRDTDYRQKIRNYALQHLSWAAIAKQTSEILIDWLQSNPKTRCCVKDYGAGSA